jgi:hypothetical protein
MAIKSLIEGTSFDPETTAILASAFEEVWTTVVRSGSSLPTEEGASVIREKLAMRIIATAAGGERDKARLVDDALAYLTTAG